ncbi:hypothetical protein OKW24_001151 [Peribacillus simplex]|nr:hypothetical protein [Peribacillus simplex]
MTEELKYHSHVFFLLFMLNEQTMQARYVVGLHCKIFNYFGSLLSCMRKEKILDASKKLIDSGNLS